MSQYSVAKELHKMTLRRITIFFGKNAHKTRKGENSQYSVAKRGSVAGLPYQPVTNAPLYFKHPNLFLLRLLNIRRYFNKYSFTCLQDPQQ